MLTAGCFGFPSLKKDLANNIVVGESHGHRVAPYTARITRSAPNFHRFARHPPTSICMQHSLCSLCSVVHPEITIHACIFTQRQNKTKSGSRFAKCECVNFFIFWDVRTRALRVCNDSNKQNIINRKKKKVAEAEAEAETHTSYISPIMCGVVQPNCPDDDVCVIACSVPHV